MFDAFGISARPPFSHGAIVVIENLPKKRVIARLLYRFVLQARSGARSAMSCHAAHIGRADYA